MVKLTEDLILMQSSESVNLSMVSSVPSTPRQQSQDESSSLDDVTPDPDSSQIPLSTVGYRKINCWGCEIDDISIVSQMPDLETVVLSSNAVHDLSPFSTCKKLSQLALRRNNVSSMGEVLHLKDLSCLKILWLKDNPVEKEDNYRLKVIKLLPQLQKLDNRVVTDAERLEATSLAFEVSSSTMKEQAEVSDGKLDITADRRVDKADSKTNKDADISKAQLENPVNMKIGGDDLKCDQENGIDNLCLGNERKPFRVSTVAKDDDHSPLSLLDGFADNVAKTSILNATQAVRQIGMKLYSAPLPNNMVYSSWLKSQNYHALCGRGDSSCSTFKGQSFSLTENRNLSKTVRAIELLLDGLTEQELNYLSQSISSKLASFSHQD